MHQWTWTTSTHFYLVKVQPSIFSSQNSSTIFAQQVFRWSGAKCQRTLDGQAIEKDIMSRASLQMPQCSLLGTTWQLSGWSHKMDVTRRQNGSRDSLLLASELHLRDERISRTQSHVPPYYSCPCSQPWSYRMEDQWPVVTPEFYALQPQHRVPHGKTQSWPTSQDWSLITWVELNYPRFQMGPSVLF